MATWNTSSSSIKVTSHATIEDRDPETYSKRGYDFELKKQYQQAEAEYIKAIKLSDDKERFTQILLLFYYRTGKKNYKAKADKIFKPWFKKYHFEAWLMERIFMYGFLVAVPLIWAYFAFNEYGLVGAAICFLFGIPGGFFTGTVLDMRRRMYLEASKGIVKAGLIPVFRVLIGFALGVVGLFIAEALSAI